MVLFNLLIIFLLLAEIRGLNLKCNENNDCQIKNSICQEKQCRCDDLYYLKGSQCLPYATEYNAYCEEKQQCEWLGENSDCIKNKCVCGKGNRWFQGKCRIYAKKGENCDDSIDCYDGQDLQSLRCVSRTCVCSSNYYDRGGDCRRKSRWPKDCALNQDCVSNHCIRGKCKWSFKSAITSAAAENDNIFLDTLLTNIFFIDINNSLSCEFDNDCREIVNSLCDSNAHKCVCPPDTFLDNGICIPGFQSCKDETDCSEISNTMCFKQKTCICKPSYFQRHGKCIAELGVKDNNYKKVEDCPIKPAALEDSTCYCKHYWFTQDGNRNCIKTMIPAFGNCLTNDWCRVMGQYSFCNSTTGKCECSSNARLNETLYYCEKISELKDNFCITDNECTKTNEQCIDERCQCVEKFYRNERGVCIPSIDGSCTHDTCPSLSGCLEGLCHCHTNSIRNGNRCLKEVINFEDPCELDVQCQKLSFTNCSLADNAKIKTCTCVDGYTEIENKCWMKKAYGDPCMTKTECTKVLNKSFQCRNNKCQCPVGEKIKDGYCSGASSFLLKRIFVGLTVFLILRFLLVAI